MGTINNVSTGTRNAACTAYVTQPDAGSGAGKVKIYTAAEATLLVTITLNDPSFGSPSTGVSSISLSPSAPTGTAVAGGVAAVAVFTDSTDDVKWKGDVTATGGGGALTIASTTIANGAIVNITGGNFTVPAA